MNDEDLITIGQRIGYSDTPAELFGISRLDRRRHLYVQGKTGSGKSTLAISMIVQDLHRGEGVCLIDPLARIPQMDWRSASLVYQFSLVSQDVTPDQVAES